MSSPERSKSNAISVACFEPKTTRGSTVPWYKPEIEQRLHPATRALYRDYSRLHDDEIVGHLHSIRQRAWPLGQYPCTGEWLFLLPSISAFPIYQTILSRVQHSATVLDLGCALDQDLWRLAADGAPSENMYASDLHSELWEIGFDLFRDGDDMKARFIQADIFDPDTPLRDLDGKIDIIIACQFLHLFSWKQQVDAAKRMVDMSRPGTCLVGYQVVGGGTSGLTVAARLAEDPHVSVAVIEGGGFYETDNGNLSQVPAFELQYSSANPADIQPLVDWGIVTEPQQQLAGRQIAYTQGKCLGGSSARNYLAYHRGTVGAFQQWADKVGDPSYTFEALLPYYEKSPHLTPPNYDKRQAGGQVLYDPKAFSPAGGPLQVSYVNFWQPISDYFRNAFASLGLTPLPGFNSGSLLGYSEFTVTIDPEAETRSSSETSFLQSAISNSPLFQIYQRTLAKRIIFNKNKTAVGVAVSTSGVPYTLSARKEVILAAGVFRSPQLLMVSGVGPAATLRNLNISVTSDLQGVGQNMWDQPWFGTSYRVNVTTQSQLYVNASLAAQATEAYLQNLTGPLTNALGNPIGFEKLPPPLRSQLSPGTLNDLAQFPADWPELEILPIAGATTATNDSDNYASFTIAVLTVTSRGNVTINSTDTSLNPLISPNWLLTKTDQEVAIQGFKRARQIAAASGVTRAPEFAPGPGTETDAQILEYLQRTAITVHHASATCAMGKAGDPDAVVDSHGKVFGVNKLRLVDISTFPILPPGHTQANVYMLAEKLADDIKKGK